MRHRYWILSYNYTTSRNLLLVIVFNFTQYTLDIHIWEIHMLSSHKVAGDIVACEWVGTKKKCCRHHISILYSLCNTAYWLPYIKSNISYTGLILAKSIRGRTRKILIHFWIKMSYVTSVSYLMLQGHRSRSKNLFILIIELLIINWREKTPIDVKGQKMLFKVDIWVWYPLNEAKLQWNAPCLFSLLDCILYTFTLTLTMQCNCHIDAI